MNLDEIYAITDDEKFMKALYEYWMKRWNDLKFYEKLTEGEKRLLRINVCGWEVTGNGFQGFFENDAGKWAHELYDDYCLIGADAFADQLKRAIDLVPGGVLPKDQLERQKMMLQLAEDEDVEQLFDRLLDEYPEGNDDLGMRFAAYARANRSHFEPSNGGSSNGGSEVK